METEVTHHESWSLTLRRGQDDDWPDSPLSGYSKQIVRPDKISGQVQASGSFNLTVHGQRVLKDGSLGQTAHIRFYDVPDWAAELTRQAIRDSDQIPVEPR